MEFFPELIGNEAQKNRIGSAILSGRSPHAFLIDGDRGSGKTTLALGIAAALNCEGAGALPCGECNTCRRIKKRGYPDLTVLEKNSDRATIGVSEVKELRSDMFLSATEAKKKVYVISDADKLTPEAQNALLIVLEEPPANVVIILLAEGTDKILTTVKSRCQYIAMQRFSRAELARHITELSETGARMARVDSEKFDTVIAEAHGSIGEALALLDPEKASELAERRNDILAVIEAFSPKKSFSELHTALFSLTQKRPELLSVLEEILSALGDLIKTAKDFGAEPVFFSDAKSACDARLGMSETFLLKVYSLILKAHESITKNSGSSAVLTRLASEIKLI